MNLAILILGPILGAALIAGGALLIARVVKGPVEIIAESSELSKSEDKRLFPPWIVWLYVGACMGFSSLHFLVNRSFQPPDPNWPLFATTLIVGLAGIVHFLRLLLSSESDRFRRVSLLMTAVSAALMIFGAIVLILFCTEQKPKPNVRSEATASPSPAA